MKADATDETKISHDKIFPLILSGQFLFCPLVGKGPYLQCVVYVWIMFFFVVFSAAEAGGRVFGSMGGGLDSDEVRSFRCCCFAMNFPS